MVNNGVALAILLMQITRMLLYYALQFDRQKYNLSKPSLSIFVFLLKGIYFINI